MGDVSIIARRLSDQYVQYGWSGNGGVFFPTGEFLLECYDDPKMVEYLFGLGQMPGIWYPYSEKTGGVFANRPTGEPHWVGPTEREIFSKIAFIDVGYFYDSDHTWYYVKPSAFRIKVPLTLVGENLNENHREFDFLARVELAVLDRVIGMCRTDPAIRERLWEKGADPDALGQELEELKGEEDPLHEFWKRYKPVYDCFDDWAVVRADKSGQGIGEILLKPKEETHTETIFWEEA